MEKVFLKPTSQEMLFKANEPGVYFDSFEYGPHDNKNKHLGHLYVIGHLKFGEENMDYVLNLISSLAKREYYSENGSAPEDPKKAFELALKKLNEVLNDFFKNKELKINLGLLAIAGEKIYISKLGKFKVLLARSDEMIDILNNVDLFTREQTEEKQFSNIVSGKIQNDDKIFAFYPTRQLSAKEKNIKTLLGQKTQQDFVTELAAMHENSKNFSCCGFHIEVNKVKEPRVQIKSIYEKGEVLPMPENQTEPAVTTTIAKESDALKSAPKSEENSAPAPGLTVSGETQLSKNAFRQKEAELSIVTRSNLFDKIGRKLSFAKIGKTTGRLPSRNKLTAVLVLTVILAGGFIAGKTFFLGNNAQKSTIKTAGENLKLAEIKLTQNENDAARDLLALSLSSISGIPQADKKVEVIKAKINALLDKIDLASARQPELFFSQSSQVVSKIAAIESESNSLTMLNQEKKVFKISETGAIEKGSAGEPESSFVFQPEKFFLVYNGLDKVGSLDTDSGKYSVYSLKDASQAKDAAVYEGNLYILGDNAIYKYSDAATGNSQKKLWLGGLTDSDKLSLAVDGNIYVLNADGTVIKYFKGKEESKVNLNFKFDYQARLLTNKSSPYFYVADYSEKRIRVFDKITGSLVLTYKASQLPLLKDIILSENALYLLTIDSQVWRINLN